MPRNNKERFRVCFVEDDVQKRTAIWEFYEDLCRDKPEIQSSLTVRFVICEQQFWDAFGPDQNHEVDYPQTVRDCPLYDPRKDEYPTLFVLDMMLQWTSKWYNSNRERRSDSYTNRAGLRIGKFLKSQLGKGATWLHWTAVDCEEIRKELVPAKLYYKDSFFVDDMFEKEILGDTRYSRHLTDGNH
jgi:hypothetical protein